MTTRLIYKMQPLVNLLSSNFISLSTENHNIVINLLFDCQITAVKMNTGTRSL